MTFYEQELEKIFGDSEFLSADTVITGKTLITKIGEDLRAKLDFVTINVHKQYEAFGSNCNEHLQAYQGFH